MITFLRKIFGLNSKEEYSYNRYTKEYVEQKLKDPKNKLTKKQIKKRDCRKIEMGYRCYKARLIS